MARRVQFAEDFLHDLQSHVDWLLAHRGQSWIEGLERGLEEAEERIVDLPDAGKLMHQEGSLVLRKLILRRLPYVVWYACEDEDTDGILWVLRLFHARQQEPDPGALHPLRKKR